MTFGTPPLPGALAAEQRRLLRAADRTADRLIAYDLVLRMEGRHGPTEPLSQEDALRIYKQAVDLARQFE